MNKKKSAIAFVIVIFLLIAVEIVYIFSELYTENDIEDKKEITNAQKFKEEYESINNTKNDAGVDIRNLSIVDDNPFIYSDAEDIVKRIENSESFVVYFGFKSCPWCRSVLNPLIEAAKEKKVKKIYYVDVLDIRDKYELDDKFKPIKTIEGDSNYMKLLEKFDNVLENYSPLTYTNKKGKEKKVKINEKRIYAPNVIVVTNGEAIALETGIVEELNDPYMEIDKGLYCNIKEKFKCLFDNIEEKSETCDISAQKC